MYLQQHLKQKKQYKEFRTTATMYKQDLNSKLVNLSQSKSSQLIAECKTLISSVQAQINTWHAFNVNILESNTKINSSASKTDKPKITI